MLRIRATCLLAFILPGLGITHAADDYPARPIKVVVPFAPGGGSDTFARIIKLAIEENDLLSQPLVIINVGGAGGTIGSRRVKDAEPDGYTVLLLHDAIFSAKYAAKVPYGPEAFLPVCGTGQTGMVIAVAEDSPFTSLRHLLNEAAERPGEVIFSANMGAPSHFVGLMLEKAHGSAELRFAQSGGGANRFAAIKGGHVDATTFSVAEYLRFQPAGIRAIAQLSAERDPELPDIPTAREQGIDVVRSVTQYWWMPEGTPPDRAQKLADILTQAMQTETARKMLAESKIDTMVLRDRELEDYLESANRQMASVDPRQELPLPNLPLWITALAGVSGIVLAVQQVRHRVRHPAPDESEGGNAKYRLSAAAAISIVYMLLVTQQVLWLSLATALFVFSLGAVLSGSLTRHWKSLTVAALVTAVLFHLVFIRIMVVDL